MASFCLVFVDLWVIERWLCNLLILLGIVVVYLFLVFVDLAIIVVTSCSMIVASGLNSRFVFVLGFGVVDRRLVVLVILAPMAG